MNFERHKEAKDSLGIGLKANADTIRQLYYLDYEEADYHSGIARRSPMVISDSREIIEVLARIERRESDPNDYAIDIESPDQFGSLVPLWQYRGKWLRFQATGFQAISANDYDNEFFRRETYFLIPTRE